MQVKPEYIDIKLHKIKEKYKSHEALPRFLEATDKINLAELIDNMWMTPEEFSLVYLMPLERVMELCHSPEEATFSERFYLLQIDTNAYEIAVQLGTRWMRKAIYFARRRLKDKIEQEGHAANVG